MRLQTVRLAAMLALVLMMLLATSAQPSTPVPRIGWLSAGSPPSGPDPNREAFQQGLCDLGYVAGQHFTITYRYAEGHLDRLPDLAAELVRLPVAVIVTGSSTPATRAAKHATSTIPIIMAGIGADPVEAGLVASLARPEGNVTGVTASSSELWGKRLELLRDAVPRLARLALLWNPTNPGNALCLSEVKSAAVAMGVQLHPLEVREADAFERAFAALAQEPPDALLTCADTLTYAHRSLIADFAVRSRLPTMTPLREAVQAGSLMFFGTSSSGQWRRAAYYVEKTLKGTKPADLPVERPMQFELIINLKTAKALRITMPPSLLLLADEVIQ